MTKRILTMQDLSCVGQCSLTVALPMLSAYGVEASILPTAILSNHTMFPEWSYLDLTPEIPHIFENWRNNGFQFDGFLLGYLGKSSLMDLAEQCFDDFSTPQSVVIIDPVMGDYGKLYGGFDEQYVQAMAHLIRRADIILPNITEACFLTHTPYRNTYDLTFVKELAQKLSKLCKGTIILTGIESDDNIGEFIYCNDNYEYVTQKKVPQNRHGTGDIFASVFTANYLCGRTLENSCQEAGRFIVECLKATDKNHPYGVNFEQVLLSKLKR